MFSMATVSMVESVVLNTSTVDMRYVRLVGLTYGLFKVYRVYLSALFVSVSRLIQQGYFPKYVLLAGDGLWSHFPKFIVLKSKNR